MRTLAGDDLSAGQCEKGECSEMKVEFDVDGLGGAAILSALRNVASDKGDGFTGRYANAIIWAGTAKVEEGGKGDEKDA